MNWKYSAGPVARGRKGVGSALVFSVVPASLAFVFSDFCLSSMVSAAHFPVDLIKNILPKALSGKIRFIGLKAYI